jgi:hypothetical protein
MEPHPDDPSEKDREVITTILGLQSRVDALTICVETLMKGHSTKPNEIRENIQKLIQTCRQKRLERIEGQNPRLAALLSEGLPAEKIDQKLLDGLQFDDQNEDGENSST